MTLLNTDIKIKLFKNSGRLVYIIATIYFIYVIYDFLVWVLGLNPGLTASEKVSVVQSNLPRFILEITVIAILYFIGKQFTALADEEKMNLVNLTIGYVKSYGRISLNELARSLNFSNEREMEKFIAEINIQGKYKCFIDGETREVYSAEEIPTVTKEKESGTQIYE